MNSSKNFVDIPPLQLALREVQMILRSKRFWLGFLAVVTILVIIGPFETINSLNSAERIVYWSLHAALTFFTGVFCAVYIRFKLTSFGIHINLAKSLGVLFLGLPISIIVWCLNHYGFDMNMGGLPQYLRLLVYCCGISISVNLLYYLITNDIDGKNTNPNLEEKADFLHRLPKHLGNKLLYISSQDHYVEATTKLGSHLILLRFSDAILELRKIAGIQIHRSYWIADDAVEELYREDGKLFIKTINDKKLPVSRSKTKSVRERYKI